MWRNIIYDFGIREYETRRNKEFQKEMSFIRKHFMRLNFREQIT